MNPRKSKHEMENGKKKKQNKANQNKPTKQKLHNVSKAKLEACQKPNRVSKPVSKIDASKAKSITSVTELALREEVYADSRARAQRSSRSCSVSASLNVAKLSN